MGLEPGEQARVEPDLAVALQQQHREVAAHAADLAATLLGRLEVAQLLVEHAAEHDAGDAHGPRPGQRLGRCARAADHDPPGGADVDRARRAAPRPDRGPRRAARRGRRCRCRRRRGERPATRSSMASGSTLITSPRTCPSTGSLPLSGATSAEPSSSVVAEQQARLGRRCTWRPLIVRRPASGAGLEPRAGPHDQARAASAADRRSGSATGTLVPPRGARRVASTSAGSTRCPTSTIGCGADAAGGRGARRSCHALRAGRPPRAANAVAPAGEDLAAIVAASRQGDRDAARVEDQADRAAGRAWR